MATHECPSCHRVHEILVPPGPGPIITGEPGTKGNPFPLNKATAMSGLYYPREGVGLDGCSMRNGGKMWYVVDSIFSNLQPVKRFHLTIKGYGNTVLRYSKVVQDRVGNDLTAEIKIPNVTGDGYDNECDVSTSMKGVIPREFKNIRFLYAVEGTETIDLWVEFTI